MVKSTHMKGPMIYGLGEKKKKTYAHKNSKEVNLGKYSKMLP
jgi:hypothetical protein